MNLKLLKLFKRVICNIEQCILVFLILQDYQGSTYIYFLLTTKQNVSPVFCNWRGSSFAILSHKHEQIASTKKLRSVSIRQMYIDIN
jgi:hypothetical protein